MEIKYFNRYSNNIETEKVYGDAAVKWMYATASGKFLSEILVKPPISKIYGFFQNTSWSKSKVPQFIDNFKINMDEFLPEDGALETDPYSSFNSFFIRKFKPDARTFSQDINQMSAFSEARYYGFSSVSENEKVPVKGYQLGPNQLISSHKWEETFIDSPLLLARLCPVDYHRFHYPLNGKVLDYYKVKGDLHSVNPLALEMKPGLLVQNERDVTILETKKFGKLAYIEVGAICVGKIVQSSSLENFSRGDEKGYFLFGGSTVIVVGEKGRWTPSQDIIKNTTNGLETYIRLGDSVGTLS